MASFRVCPELHQKPTIICRLSKYFQRQSAMRRLHPFSAAHILQSRSWADQPQWLVQDIRCKKDLKGSQQSCRPSSDSWTAEESEVESREYQDDANVHGQPFPEVVSEERDIDTDNNRHHCHAIKHDSDLSAHSVPIARPIACSCKRPARLTPRQVVFLRGAVKTALRDSQSRIVANRPKL